MLATMENTRPERTARRMCAGCGDRAEQAALVRLVVGPTAPYVAVDLGRKLGGRGVSVHARRNCIRQALRGGTLLRALRGVGQVEAETVERLLVAQLEDRFAGLLSSALRARRLAVGSEAVRAELARGSGHLLVVAGDGRGRVDEFVDGATAMGCAVATWGTKASLGQVLSRRELAVLLIMDKGIARAAQECLTLIEALSEGE